MSPNLLIKVLLYQTESGMDERPGVILIMKKMLKISLCFINPANLMKTKEFTSKFVYKMIIMNNDIKNYSMDNDWRIPTRLKVKTLYDTD